MNASASCVRMADREGGYSAAWEQFFSQRVLQGHAGRFYMSDVYEGFTDEELIDRQRSGERQITDYIMDKYKNLVRKKAKSMYILGADNDDLIQEGMIGLFKAVRDYDPAGRQLLYVCDLHIAPDVQCSAGIAQGETYAAQHICLALHGHGGGGGRWQQHGACQCDRVRVGIKPGAAHDRPGECGGHRGHY